MPPAGVRLLHSALLASAACCLFLGACVTGTAAAVGGGTALPPGATTVDPAAAETITPTAAPESAVAAPGPALRPPPLAAVTLRPGDPLVTDLAAITSPSAVVAVGGRVLMTRIRGKQAELVDMTDPALPRILMAGTRAFGSPHGGVDAAGRPVVVLSPCAGESSVLVGGQAPRCPLRAVDVVTGTSRPIPGTTGALTGDLDGANVTFARGSTVDGVRLYRAAGTRARLIGLPIAPAAWATARGGTGAVRGTLRLTALDSADRRLALVTEYRDGRGRAVAALWLQTGERWRQLAAVAASQTGQGSPHLLGPQLDGAGVTAYVEGVVDRPSFLGRWLDDGSQPVKVSVRRSIGRATILASAALSGEHLVFVDGRPGVPCGSEASPSCGLRRVGPLPVR